MKLGPGGQVYSSIATLGSRELPLLRLAKYGDAELGSAGVSPAVARASLLPPFDRLTVRLCSLSLPSIRRLPDSGTPSESRGVSGVEGRAVTLHCFPSTSLRAVSLSNGRVSLKE